MNIDDKMSHGRLRAEDAASAAMTARHQKKIRPNTRPAISISSFSAFSAPASRSVSKQYRVIEMTSNTHDVNLAMPPYQLAMTAVAEAYGKYCMMASIKLAFMIISAYGMLRVADMPSSSLICFIDKY